MTVRRAPQVRMNRKEKHELARLVAMIKSGHKDRVWLRDWIEDYSNQKIEEELAKHGHSTSER